MDRDRHATEPLKGKYSLHKRVRARWNLSWWKLALIVLACLAVGITLLLLIIALMRAGLVSSAEVMVPSVLNLETTDLIDESKMDERSRRFAKALSIQTVSYDADNQDDAGFLEMHKFLQDNFPLIHRHPNIRRDVINQYSLLYQIDGTVPGTLPYLLAAHLDVVPADPSRWEVPPFSGRIVNNTYIYGRGAMDDKAGVMGIMEALEYMLSKGERPKRTFYLAFGHDEEIGGRKGNQMIAKELTRRGVTKLDFLVDEGFPISTGIISVTDKQIAMIGVSEKGIASVQLTVVGTPSHSSFPPQETAIGILGAAVSRLEANPQPAVLSGPGADMYNYLLPYMSFGDKFMYNNFWLFSGNIKSNLEKQSFTNAIIRTTSAITIFNGGVKENVVPAVAKATINHRIHPSRTVKETIEYDIKVINDPRVMLNTTYELEAPPVSPYAGPDAIPFQMVATSIKQVYKEAVVAPGCLIGNTDTRWYTQFTKHIFRFLPTVVTPVDALRYHGDNERMSVKHYHNAVNFFYRLIKNADLILDDTTKT